jgi:hypothetical protein
MSRLTLGAVLSVGVLAAQLASAPRAPADFMPADEVRPGMTGVGRTVFNGDTVEEFQVQILGVLHNVIGPRRDLILARLSGGPLAETGVIAGMSGSPVYINGRLLGAVSYALGSFPREPLAGITPIAEMTSEADSSGPRTRTADLDLPSPVTPTAVFSALQHLAERAVAPLALSPGAVRVSGPASLVDLAPALRPIGAAFVMSGFDPSVSSGLRQALGSPGGAAGAQAPGAAATTPQNPLKGGDPVGVSLVRGDFEMGATGTVTYVSGTRVYAFGHPFLNLGPTSMALTRAHIYAVLPSLESSMKIAGLGPVIGTLTQDRATAIGGLLGPPPHELHVTVLLTSDRAKEQRFTFSVVHDPALTPLFAYVAVLNALSSYERQNGALTVEASGTIDFGPDGRITFDDMFAGESVAPAAAAAVMTPISAMVANEWHRAMPETLDVRVHTSEQQTGSTIERAWLDTTKPIYGATQTLHVLLRNYRGTAETVSLPVTMPAQPSGPLTLLVSDAPTLTSIEQRELRPGKPRSLPELMETLNSTRRNTTIYVRLLSSSAGTVVAGETLPALPASTREILNADRSTASAPLSKSVVGAWELRLDRVIRGSRELPITLTSKRP